MKFTSGILDFFIRTNPNEVELIGVTRDSVENIVIPPSVKDYASDKIYKVVRIGANSFYNCRTTLRSITIPETVMYIDDDAFKDCTKLSFINMFSDSVGLRKEVFIDTSWWKNQPNNSWVYLGNILIGFKGTCRGNELKVKEGTTLLSGWVFEGYRKLTSITLPNSLRKIPYCAFIGCSNLSSLIIPDSVISIGDWAFEGCKSLTSIVIPNSVKSLGTGLFKGCSNLQKVVLANILTRINGTVFWNCTSLTTISIPDSVISIGNYAFEGCKSLISINIPYSVTTIGKGAFVGCSKLDTIIIENTPENITFDFANNSDDQWISKVQFVGQPENVEQLKAAAAARVAAATKKAASKEAAAPAEAPKVEPTPAPSTPIATPPAETPKPAAPTINLETLIAAALVDGIVTDKERAILCKKVKEAGGDVDEFEMLLDARIYEAQQKNQTSASTEVVNQPAIHSIEQKTQEEVNTSNVATPEQPKSEASTTSEARKRDKADYLFNGKVYTKKVQLVHDLVLHHLSLHPNLTHEQLKKDFYCQKNMDVMFMSYEMYLSTLAEKGVVYFYGDKTEKDTIALKDAKILISSNWPTMVGGKPSVFAKLIEKVKELGYEITVQE